MGRPKIDIDFELVDNLIKIFCTGEEIASVLGVHYDTLYNRVKEEFDMTFSDYIKSKQGEGKASLRRMQWKKAQAGNSTMLVWLGKQYLGQTDKQELTGKDGGAIKIESPRKEIESRIASIAARQGDRTYTE